MAMDIGSILVCGDYKGDLKQIAHILGRLISYYPGDETAFQVDEDKHRLVWNGDCCLSVSVSPERHSLKLNDGSSIFADEADESVLSQWRNDGSHWDREDCDLETVSRLILPLLQSGTIELVSASIARFSIWHERLIIRCDGSVELHSHNSLGVKEGWTFNMTDRYEPAAKKAAA